MRGEEEAGRKGDVGREGRNEKQGGENVRRK